MPLTDQMRQFLDLLGGAMMPSVSEVGVETCREALANVPVAHWPEMAAVTDTVAPAADGHEIPVRLFRPDTESDDPLPVLCYFHGGGWVIGGIDMTEDPCRRLAAKVGCLVISPDYRLAPEHSFPTAAEDCYAVAAWAADHASEHGGDGANLAVSGGSAGGNLAAAVALMARDRGRPELCFQFLEYPMIDADFDRPSFEENAEGYMLTTADCRLFWELYVPDGSDRRNPYVAPLHADDLSGLPPALIITAQYDPLRDEAETYGASLDAAGVPTTVTRYDGVIHGFYAMVGLVDEAEVAEDQVATALRAAFAA